jgi:N-hydroxyarylamine O-acetyltransferase
MMTFDLATYLSRIGLTDCPPTLEGLKALQRYQCAAIPFENALPFTGRVPDVGPDGIWQKIVGDKRGGYCFELNTLLGQALEALGFSAIPVLARVRMGAAEGGIRNHLAHIVTLDGTEWLVDAGFGSSTPAEPVNLTSGEPQEIFGRTYRIRRDQAAGEEVLERLKGEDWQSLYGFDRLPPKTIDIEAANYLCATWEKSSFPTNMKLYRLTDEGRLSFINGTARKVSGGEDRSWQIDSLEELETFMTADMGLDYDPDTIRAIWTKLEEMAADAAVS